MDPDVTYQATEDGKLAVVQTTTDTQTYTVTDLKKQLTDAQSNRSAQETQHQIDDKALAEEILRIQGLIDKATQLGLVT